MTLSKRFPVGPHDRELVLNVGPRDWPAPRPAERYALVAIGAGAGGLVSAMGTAGLGGRTAILERNLLGGDCLMTLRFSRAVIATGAAPVRPPLPGVEEVLTTEDLWNLVELPRRLSWWAPVPSASSWPRPFSASGARWWSWSVPPGASRPSRRRPPPWSRGASRRRG